MTARFAARFLKILLIWKYIYESIQVHFFSSDSSVKRWILGRKAGSSVKEIGKTDSIKKEKTPRRSKKDEIKLELTSPAPANDSNRSSQRKRKRKSEIEDMDDEEEDEGALKTYR
jgi:hypothetical protein